MSVAIPLIISREGAGNTASTPGLSGFGEETCRGGGGAGFLGRSSAGGAGLVDVSCLGGGGAGLAGGGGADFSAVGAPSVAFTEATAADFGAGGVGLLGGGGFEVLLDTAFVFGVLTPTSLLGSWSPDTASFAPGG